MKIGIVRATSEGETMTVEAHLGKPDEWDAKVGEALKYLDARVLEQNMRYINAHKVVERFPKEYQAAAKMLIDCLYGRQIEQLGNLPFPREEAEPSKEQPGEPA